MVRDELEADLGGDEDSAGNRFGEIGQAGLQVGGRNAPLGNEQADLSISQSYRPGAISY